MTLKEILQKYFTLTTINLDKPIMLCADKKTFRYEYFTLEDGENYHFVDADTRKYLNDQFTNKLPHIYYEDIEQNEMELTAKVRLAIDRIAIFFSDVQDTKITIDKLEDVKIELDFERKNSCFDAKNNTIFLKRINLGALEHEYLHALAVDEDSYSSGFCCVLGTDYDETVAEIGRGLNEAITQYFVNEINHTRFKTYTEFVEIIEQILPKDENLMRQIKSLYLSGNLEVFVQLLSDYYHLQNDEPIMEFILKMDLLLMARNHQISIDYDDIYEKVLQSMSSIISSGTSITGNQEKVD